MENLIGAHFVDQSEWVMLSDEGEAAFLVLCLVSPRAGVAALERHVRDNLPAGVAFSVLPLPMHVPLSVLDTAWRLHGLKGVRALLRGT